MRASPWYTVLLDVSVDADATAEQDLRENYEFLTVIIPTLNTASKLEAQVAMSTGGTFYPVWRWDAATATDLVGQTSNATTTRTLTFYIGGAQHVKVGVEGADMTEDETFYFRGFNR